MISFQLEGTYCVDEFEKELREGERGTKRDSPSHDNYSSAVVDV